MRSEFGEDPYGAPDGKFRSYGSSEPRRTNGHATPERSMSIVIDRVRIVPIGVKRVVPEFAQGQDPYGAPDGKMGSFTFDARPSRATRRTMV